MLEVVASFEHHTLVRMDSVHTVVQALQIQFG